MFAILYPIVDIDIAWSCYNNCYAYIVQTNIAVTECIRLGAVITTVMHLLLLSILHTASVAAPMGVKKVIESYFSNRIIITIIIIIIKFTSFDIF